MSTNMGGMVILADQDVAIKDGQPCKLEYLETSWNQISVYTLGCPPLPVLVAKKVSFGIPGPNKIS